MFTPNPFVVFYFTLETNRKNNTWGNNYFLYIAKVNEKIQLHVSRNMATADKSQNMIVKGNNIH